jgi:hypothetical protein
MLPILVLLVSIDWDPHPVPLYVYDPPTPVVIDNHPWTPDGDGNPHRFPQLIWAPPPADQYFDLGVKRVADTVWDKFDDALQPSAAEARKAAMWIDLTGSPQAPYRCVPLEVQKVKQPDEYPDWDEHLRHMQDLIPD